MYFIAQELIPGYLNGVEGTYHTPKGYYVAFDNPKSFEEYEAGIPPKEKAVKEGQIVDDCTKNPNDNGKIDNRKADTSFLERVGRLRLV